MSSFRKLSFSAGEVSPSLYAAVDQFKYQSGLKTLRNFMVKPNGVENRPGTRFVAEVKSSASQVRLEEFVFNSDQTYVLEFGNLYMRAHRNGAQLTDLTLTITAITNASPAVVTYTGTDPSNGDEVYISGVVGAIGTFINGRSFKIANVNGGANTFELRYMDAATAVNSASWGAYTSGGTAARVYEIVTPYTTANLSSLRFSQNANIVTITSPNYTPAKLSRSGHTSWSLKSDPSTAMFDAVEPPASVVSTTPELLPPTFVSVAAGGAGALTFRYAVTRIYPETDPSESHASSDHVRSISSIAITSGTSITVTCSAAHSFVGGDEVLIAFSLLGEVNYRRFRVASVASPSLVLTVQDTTGYSAVAAGGFILREYWRLGSALGGTTGAPNVLTIRNTMPLRHAVYKIYRSDVIPGAFGFIGTTTEIAPGADVTFNDTGITPDYTRQPPVAVFPFIQSGAYPAASAVYQQRQIFGGATNTPEQIAASDIAALHCFKRRTPLTDDAAFTFNTTGNRVGQVMHLLQAAKKLLVFTSESEFVVNGNSSGALTPSEPNCIEASANGSGLLPPLPANNTILYLQARGNRVRDFGFEYEIDGYRGNDISLFSNHLFDRYTITDWAYQKTPHQRVWLVRSDGILLSCTYIREQGIIGWSRHDTDGLVESVCSIPEGEEDAVYIVVKRTIPGLTSLGGATRRYIERFTTRRSISEPRVALTSDGSAMTTTNSAFLDSHLSYDGRNTNNTLTMTLSGGTTWVYSEDLTLTSSASYFSAQDVGNKIFLYIVDSAGAVTDQVRCTIKSYTGATVVTVNPHKTVPVAFRSVALFTWAKAVDQLSGLWHLEGKELAVIGDDLVSDNPNNGGGLTVTNGVITKTDPQSVIFAGLPYLSDLETLDIDFANTETRIDKKKNITRVTLYVNNSRAFWSGKEDPGDSEPLTNLSEMLSRSQEDSMDNPPPRITGQTTVQIKNGWSEGGRIFVRQVDPLPLEILAAVPTGIVP